jgi:hypothetical protein
MVVVGVPQDQRDDRDQIDSRRQNDLVFRIPPRIQQGGRKPESGYERYADIFYMIPKNDLRRFAGVQFQCIAQDVKTQCKAKHHDGVGKAGTVERFDVGRPENGKDQYNNQIKTDEIEDTHIVAFRASYFKCSNILYNEMMILQSGEFRCNQEAYCDLRRFVSNGVLDSCLSFNQRQPSQNLSATAEVR